MKRLSYFLSSSEKFFLIYSVFLIPHQPEYSTDCFSKICRVLKREFFTCRLHGSKDEWEWNKRESRLRKSLLLAFSGEGSRLAAQWLATLLEALEAFISWLGKRKTRRPGVKNLTWIYPIRINRILDIPLRSKNNDNFVRFLHVNYFRIFSIENFKYLLENNLTWRDKVKCKVKKM